MVTFEVLGPVPDGADRVVAGSEAILWRTAGHTYLAVRSAAAILLREAALAGLSLRPVPVPPAERTPGAIEAHGRDLRPIPCDQGTIDRIEICPVPLAEATRALLRRRFRIAPVPAARRARCRELLHDRDLAYRASRVVWCPRSELRSVADRSALRPVVFDRGAGAPPLSRTASSSELAVWLRG